MSGKVHIFEKLLLMEKAGTSAHQCSPENPLQIKIKHLMNDSNSFKRPTFLVHDFTEGSFVSNFFQNHMQSCSDHHAAWNCIKIICCLSRLGHDQSQYSMFTSHSHNTHLFESHDSRGT
jgi:hypothetical protein